MLLLYIITIKAYVIAALQKVALRAEAEALSKIAVTLNRNDSKQKYVIITHPIQYLQTEYYAFLLKTSKVKKIGEAWLENT